MTTFTLECMNCSAPLDETEKSCRACHVAQPEFRDLSQVLAGKSEADRMIAISEGL